MVSYTAAASVPYTKLPRSTVLWPAGSHSLLQISSTFIHKSSMAILHPHNLSANPSPWLSTGTKPATSAFPTYYQVSRLESYSSRSLIRLIFLSCIFIFSSYFIICLIHWSIYLRYLHQIDLILTILFLYFTVHLRYSRPPMFHSDSGFSRTIM